MQLPSELLTVLEQLVEDIERSDTQIRPQLLSKARLYLRDFKSNDDRIFERGRYTDFEMLLFERAFSAQLRRDEKALRLQLGILQSDIQEKDDIIKGLTDEVQKKQKRLNAALNPKIGERHQFQLNAELQRLQSQVETLKTENAKLNGQLKASRTEISNLIARFYQNRAA